MRRWVFALSVLSGCARTAPPLPEVVVEVDTDVAVPRLLSRLRVDLYDEAGVWLESRDLPLRDESDWPASFSLFASDERPRTVHVRARGYRDIAVRDYRGERFVGEPSDDEPAAALPTPPPLTDEPRLVRGGADVTPGTEPAPASAIDRLFRVRLLPEERARVRVVLSGGCAGKMADLARRTTCIDGLRVPEDEPERRAESAPRVARQRRFGVVPPPEGEAPEGAVPVTGGAFVLGGRDYAGGGVLLGERVSSQPERVVVVSSFFIDREEVTIARFRAALARGFAPRELPYPNDRVPLPEDNPSLGPRDLCTWTSTALDPDREQLAVTCVPHETARAFCRFEGGDLPTEAQWEYVAKVAGHPRDALFPWGAASPSCERAMFGRMSTETLQGDATCLVEGFPFGAAPVTAAPLDVTPLGVHGLAGGVGEWAMDSFRSYDTACWRRAPQVDPKCEDPSTPLKTVRGGAWSGGTNGLLTFVRRPGEPEGYLDSGFRCAYARGRG
jgi:formylglycine-generating enzyme required for sulfatase activity